MLMYLYMALPAGGRADRGTEYSIPSACVCWHDPSPNLNPLEQKKDGTTSLMCCSHTQKSTARMNILRRNPVQRPCTHRRSFIVCLWQGYQTLPKTLLGVRDNCEEADRGARAGALVLQAQARQDVAW